MFHVFQNFTPKIILHFKPTQMIKKIDQNSKLTKNKNWLKKPTQKKLKPTPTPSILHSKKPVTYDMDHQPEQKRPDGFFRKVRDYARCKDSGGQHTHKEDGEHQAWVTSTASADH